MFFAELPLLVPLLMDCQYQVVLGGGLPRSSTVVPQLFVSTHGLEGWLGRQLGCTKRPLVWILSPSTTLVTKMITLRVLLVVFCVVVTLQALPEALVAVIQLGSGWSSVVLKFK
ncbi:hypothetical protein HX109_10805 [Galbibacter sp. BG1]|nr:hypothetical protein HX109_10805 [Galbibacter sp. BG1]